MGNPAATLERENLSAMNAPTSELEEAQQPRAANLKFTYASGSRPLEGYTIKRGVGRGGFGEVYFATSDAGKEVALKLIRRNLDVELRGVTQCLNLKHPNLISLYDIRTDEMGDQWVVMEYVSGESLEDLIDRHPSGMPVEQVLWWMRGVCGGVAYLHDHGIVHRDLKPGNIFSDEGTVKIGDYGLAKFISCSRRSGQTESVGTVHYMAPEIANGRYGREIDTYALGIILFEMLTGRVPFEGESVGEVLMKHLTAEPDLTMLAEPYRNIVERALAKDPDVRLKSVNELLALLPGSDAIGGVPSGNAPPIPQADWTYARDSSPRTPAMEAHERLKQAVNPKPAATSAPLEEPIWKAIRENFHKANPVKRGLLIFALVAACVMYFNQVVSMAIPLLISYAIYRAVWGDLARRDAAKSRASQGAQVSANFAAQRSDQHTVAWTNENSAGATVATPPPVASRASQKEARRRARTNWRELANQELAARPLRDKISELLGSMLLAAVFSAVAAAVVPLLFSNLPFSEQLATYMWVAIVGTLGSWAILVPTKLVEGKLEDQVPMRITHLSLGAALGLAAWLLGSALLMKSPGWGEPIDIGQGLVSHEMLGWAETSRGHATVMSYVAYFAFLFLLPRWWRQAEYTRTSRLSVWCVLACVGTAWLLHVFWWFPQPTGMMAAGVTSVATQLASPWMPPSRRKAISERAHQPVV
jgi:serine/threonine protein kinase